MDTDEANLEIPLFSRDSEITNDDKNSIVYPNFGENYQVLSFIGEGSSGAVYKVLESNTNKIVAIKLFHSNLSDDVAAKKRFENELGILEQLRYHSVSPACGHGITADGMPFIVMDFVSGKSLAKTISEKGSLSLEDALDVFIQVCSALDQAHQLGVVHRDLKPSNIILSPEGNAALVDFGISSVTSTNATCDVTQNGEITGSPTYMSPEQCLGSSPDRQSDIYSLGCVMYEALASFAPFTGDNQIQVVAKHLNSEPPPPFGSNVTESKLKIGLERVIMRCLQKSRSNRYDSVSSVLTDLELVQKGKQPIPYTLEKVGTNESILTAVKCVLLTSVGLIYCAAYLDIINVFVLLFPLGALLLVVGGLGAVVFISSTIRKYRSLSSRLGFTEVGVFDVLLSASLAIFFIGILPMASCLVALEYQTYLSDGDVRRTLEFVIRAIFLVHVVLLSLSLPIFICRYTAQGIARSAAYMVAKYSIVVTSIVCLFVFVFPAETAHLLVVRLGYALQPNLCEQADFMYALSGKIDSSSAQPYEAMALLANHTSGDRDREFYALSRAIEIQAEPWHYLNRAEILAEQENFLGARADLDKAIKLAKEYDSFRAGKKETLFANPTVDELVVERERIDQGIKESLHRSATQ